MEVGALGFTKKRAMSGSTSDMLSNLPSNVQEKILACMTIQDAVRTSVLSRKWRYIWTTLPELVFDDKFCKGMMRATAKELLMTIYKVLLLHHGPILKFVLTLAKLENCAEINQLIYFLSTKGIRLLTFHIRKGEPYKMPSTLFSCLQLEQLNLHSCVFRPPPGFEGFTKLLSLELYEVDLAGDVFTSLISSCPLLERLTIYYCTCINYLELPNLKYIQCEGLFRSICSRNLSPAADISMELKRSRNQLGFNEGEISNSVMLLGIIPVVKFLVLDYAYVKFLAVSGVRVRLPTTLNSLRDIMLNDICFGEPDEVSIVLYFISRSPNLRALAIRAFQGGTAATNPVVELGDVQCLFYSLRSVYLEEVSGTTTEMDFIKLLLAKSPYLLRMSIKLKSKEVAEELRIVKELTGFKRVSRDAVITFF